MFKESLASALAFTVFAMNAAISLSWPGSLLKPLFFFSSHCLSQCVEYFVMFTSFWPLNRLI